MFVDLFRPFARAAAVVSLALLAFASAAGGQAAAPPEPGSADALYRSAAAAFAAKNYAAAEEAFQRLRELEPRNHRGLMGLVQTYLAQSRFDEATRLLEAESSFDPDSRDLTAALGNVYVAAGKWDQAISQFQKVLDATGKGTRAAGELYLALGEIYRRKNDLASAVSALKNARQTLPNDPRVLSPLALLLEATSSWEAQQAYEDAIRVDPNNALLLNNLAFNLAEHGGDLDRALSLARHAQRLAPTAAEIADTVGWVYLKKGMLYEARAAFAPLVQKDPGNTAFRDHLAMALDQKGEANPGLLALLKALRAQPTDANRRQVLELLKSAGLPVSR
ncbi:MAG: tetratricopeptide repeat protein [Bryobacteraceae bacterium]|jgi:tetratricopeptide (TPR) repeat protein